MAPTDDEEGSINKKSDTFFILDGILSRKKYPS